MIGNNLGPCDRTVYMLIDRSYPVVKEVYLNLENILAVMVPQPNLIQVNVTATGRILNVIYRAKHLILTPDKGTDKVELPANLFGALFSYVAFLVHSSMNTKEAVENAQKYFVEYQNIVNEIIQNQTFTPDKLTLDKKFICRGWV